MVEAYSLQLGAPYNNHEQKLSHGNSASSTSDQAAKQWILSLARVGCIQQDTHSSARDVVC